MGGISNPVNETGSSRPCGLLSDTKLQWEGCCQGEHQIQDVFNIESKENRCEVYLLQLRCRKANFVTDMQS